MSLEKAIEEIKKIFWGVIKGEFSPDEEEDVKAHLISLLATLTSFAKSFLPPDRLEDYEKHFSDAKDILQKFDSAGPWFRELPEMMNTIYNVITFANMLQIEYQRYSGVETDSLQFISSKLEALEMRVNSVQTELKKINSYLPVIFEKIGIPTFVVKEEPADQEELADQEEVVEEEKVPDNELLEIIDSDLTIIEETEAREPQKEDLLEVGKGKSKANNAQDLIEGIELASQYKPDSSHKPIIESLMTEKESLAKLANLLTVLDSNNDNIISPLTKKLISLGENDEILSQEGVSIEETMSGIEIEEGMSEEDIQDIHDFRESVSRLSSILTTPQSKTEAASFVSTIKETIATVSSEKEVEISEKSKLTKIIEEQSEEVEGQPVQSVDIQNVITHLETKRLKAVERIQQLEQTINSENVDEEEWQDLMIKSQKHLLRIEDTLDGYKRYLTKLKS